MAENKEVRDAVERLALEQSRFAASIRVGQMAGMTPIQIGHTVGLKATVVRELINAWGLNT